MAFLCGSSRARSSSAVRAVECAQRVRAVSAVRRPQWLACAVCATLPYVEAGQTMTFLFLITLHGGWACV